MDSDKLVDFGTIKTVHGDVEAAFCIFIFQGSLSLYNKDFQQYFILEYQCIAGQTGLHFVIFFRI